MSLPLRSGRFGFAGIAEARNRAPVRCLGSVRSWRKRNVRLRLHRRVLLRLRLMDLRHRRDEGLVNVPKFDQLVGVAGQQRDSAPWTDQRPEHESANQPGEEHQYSKESKQTGDVSRVGSGGIDICDRTDRNCDPEHAGSDDQPSRDPPSKPNQSAAGPCERQEPARPLSNENRHQGTERIGPSRRRREFEPPPGFRRRAGHRAHRGEVIGGQLRRPDLHAVLAANQPPAPGAGPDRGRSGAPR